MFVNSPIEPRFDTVEAKLSEDAAPLAFKRAAEKERAQGRLLVRAVVADQLHVSAPVRLLIPVAAMHAARALPVNDHGSAARIKLLILHYGRNHDIKAEARHA